MNPYQVLDVAPSATLPEIESRYRELLLMHHPDLHRQDGDEVVARAEQKTRQLNQAMAMLRRQHPVDGVKMRSTSSQATGQATRPGPPPPGYDGVGFSWDAPPPQADRVYRCPLCGTVLDTLPEFEQHCADAHDISLDPAPKARRRRRRYDTAGWRLFGRLAAFVAIMGLTVLFLRWAGTVMYVYGTFTYVVGMMVAAWVVLVAWLLLPSRKPNRR